MIKGFHPYRTPFEERPTEYRWKASHGRYLRPQDMTDEHLINCLNWIERGSPWPGIPNDEQIGAGHHYLRLEAIRRGIRWRSYVNMSLNDGDISKRASQGIAVPTPLQETVALGQICVGRPFVWNGETFLKVSPMGDVLDSILTRYGSPDLKHFGRPGLSEALYSLVVKIRTGSCYMKPNSTQVFKTVDLVVMKMKAETTRGNSDSDTMEAWGPEYRC